MALTKQWIGAVERDATIIEAAVARSLPRFGYAALKSVQAEAIRDVLHGKDMFVTVPTGYGKSLIYQILHFCAAKILEGLCVQPPRTPCILVGKAVVHGWASLQLVTNQYLQLKAIADALLALDAVFCGYRLRPSGNPWDWWSLCWASGGAVETFDTCSTSIQSPHSPVVHPELSPLFSLSPWTSQRYPSADIYFFVITSFPHSSQASAISTFVLQMA